MSIDNQILDTTAGDTGATQTVTRTTQFTGRNSQVQIQIGSGDTVVIEGKLDSTLNFVTLATYTADDLVNLDLPPIFRARRTVDGASEDSQVWVRSFGDY